MEKYFGIPVLDWSRQDAATAIKLTGDCATAAKKARNKPEINALTVLWRSFGALNATLGAIAVTEPKIDAWLKYLLEHQPSIATLDALVVAASVRDGSADAMGRTDKALKDSSLRLNRWEHPHTHAQNLLKTLRDAPEKSWARVFPPIDARIVEVREAVIRDSIAQIDAFPVTPQGLDKLGPWLEKTSGLLSVSLSPADLDKLNEAAAIHQGRIEAALLAQQIAEIEAATADAAGLKLLLAAQQNPVRKSLPVESVVKLDSKINERRAAIGKVVTDEQISQLEQFPNTMAGLRELDSFNIRVAAGLKGLAGAEQTGRFVQAVRTRASKIGEAAFPTFRESLDKLPQTEEGLGEFEYAMNEISGALNSLEPGVRQRYLDAAGKQRTRIVAAVERENARLAKLPLDRGAIFLDPELGTRLEIRDRKRLYLTVFNEMIEAGYELDGDRLILQMPGGNQVLTRDGAWFRGSGLNLKRQPN